MSLDPPQPTAQRHRSHGHKSNPLLKVVLFGAGILLVAGVAAVFAGQAWLESYLKSTPFRTRVEAGIGHALNAHVQLAPFKRDGTSVFADTLASEGNQGAPFRTLQLHSLRADLDLSALWHRAWHIETILMQRLDLNLEAPATAEPPAEAPSSVTSASWLTQFLPNHTEFGVIKAEKSNIRKGPIEAQQVRLTATRPNQDWEILAEGGELHLPNLPLLDISNAKLVLRPKACVIRSSRLLLRNGGEVLLTGEWSEPAGTDLHVRLANVAIEPFLSTWWQTKLKGNAEGELHFKQGPASDANRQLTGTIQLKNGRLEALPILSQLDTFLGNPRFRSVPLKAASAKITVTPTRTELHELDLDGDGLIRIQGNILIEGQQLAGQLKLGLSPALTQWLPAVRSALFAEQRDGYVWIPIQLSGTVNNPVEDLTAKLLGSTKDAVINTLKNVVPTNTPPIPEAAKGLLDTLKSVIPGR